MLAAHCKSSPLPPSTPQLLPLTAYLAAERAEVLGVLADLHLLDLLTETRSIASSVLAHNANLLGALRLQQQAAANAPTPSAEPRCMLFEHYVGFRSR